MYISIFYDLYIDRFEIFKNLTRLGAVIKYVCIGNVLNTFIHLYIKKSLRERERERVHQYNSVSFFAHQMITISQLILKSKFNKQIKTLLCTNRGTPVGRKKL